MSQTLVLRNGFYECPNCKTLFEIDDGDPENGDGVCDECTEECADEDPNGHAPIRLRYVGTKPPAGCDR